MNIFDFLKRIPLSTTTLPTNRIDQNININDLPNNPITAIPKSFIDNCIRQKIEEPKRGSLVYCSLAFGSIEHTGIYVGNNQIIHKNGDGYIEKVTAKQFLERLDGFNLAISIYVSCSGSNSIGDEYVAKRAESKLYSKSSYSLLSQNCHQFSSGCLTGDFKNTNKFFYEVKNTAETELNANNWRVWDIDIS